LLPTTIYHFSTLGIVWSLFVVGPPTDEFLKNALIDEHKILEFRLLYAKSAIARAKGDYTSSYKYAKEGQQLADQIQPGVLTAWFFNHVAIVEKFLSLQQQLQGEEYAEMERSALNHYSKALQYAKASSVEQEFTRMIADLKQIIHIFRAITILGDFATGTNLSEVTASNIKAAVIDLGAYKDLVLEGFLPSNYRRTYTVSLRSVICVSPSGISSSLISDNNSSNNRGNNNSNNRSNRSTKRHNFYKMRITKLLKPENYRNSATLKNLLCTQIVVSEKSQR
jgi:hypothetical protein